MTNSIAIGLALCITAFLFFDYSYQDWEGSFFLLKKGDDLIEWMAFWR